MEVLGLNINKPFLFRLFLISLVLLSVTPYAGADHYDYSDGQCIKKIGDDIWAVMSIGVGTGTGTNIAITTKATTNHYEQVARFVWSFNTSAVPDGYVPTEAYINIKSTNTAMYTLSNDHLVVVKFNGDGITTDHFNDFGKPTILGESSLHASDYYNGLWDNITITDFNDWLNPDGKTWLGIMWYLDATDTVSWAGSKYLGVDLGDADLYITCGPKYTVNLSTSGAYCYGSPTTFTLTLGGYTNESATYTGTIYDSSNTSVYSTSNTNLNGFYSFDYDLPIDNYTFNGTAEVNGTPYSDSMVFSITTDCHVDFPDDTGIVWDEDEYTLLETALATYTISDTDWDTSKYTYEGKILDTDGTTVLDTWTISTQPDNEVESVFVDTTLFDTPGTYYCALFKERKSTHVETLMSFDTAYIDFTEYVTVFGTTYDAVNGTSLASVNVSAAQTGTTQYETSSAWGAYSIGGLYNEAWILVNGTKTGWTCTPVGFTPTVAGPVNVDLALITSGGATPGDWNDDGDGAYTDPTYSDSNTTYWNATANGTAIGGYVYAGPLMTATSGALVTIANGTWNDTYTTAAGGWYMFDEVHDGMEPGEYTLTVSKSGYESVSANATTIEDYFARMDFYLGIGTYTDDSSSDENTSYWDTGDGTGAGGIVYLGPLWSAAEGATVAIANGTWSDSFTTLAGGWWQYDEADGLADNETYTMTVSKTGYDTVTANITCLADNFTRKDFYLGEIYALTVHIKDSKTESYITTSNVTAILGGATSTTVTTTDGTAEFTGLSYGLYSLSVSADGYYAVSTSVTVESATDTETVYLLAKEDSDESGIGDSGPGSNYPPHMVRITYMDTMGNPVDGATVTATAVESSTPWDWMAGAFGFDSESVDIRNETLIGTTDSSGTITFLMVESVRYSVNCVQSTDGVDHTFSVFPKESEYFIRIGTLPVVTSYPAYNLTAYDLNATHVRLSMNYTDAANQTSTARFIVENISGSEVYNGSVSLTNGTGSAYYDVANTKGDSYSFRFEANNSQHGTITSMMGIDLKGSGRLVEFGWPALWYYLLSFGCLFMLAGAFGEMDVKIGGILVPLIGAGIFWYIGWLPVNLGSIIFVAVFVGVFYYMRAKLPAVTDG